MESNAIPLNNKKQSLHHYGLILFGSYLTHYSDKACRLSWITVFPLEKETQNCKCNRHVSYDVVSLQT